MSVTINSLNTITYPNNAISLSSNGERLVISKEDPPSGVGLSNKTSTHV